MIIDGKYIHTASFKFSKFEVEQIAAHTFKEGIALRLAFLTPFYIDFPNKWITIPCLGGPNCVDLHFLSIAGVGRIRRGIRIEPRAAHRSTSRSDAKCLFADDFQILVA